MSPTTNEKIRYSLSSIDLWAEKAFLRMFPTVEFLSAIRVIGGWKVLYKDRSPGIKVVILEKSSIQNSFSNSF